ncbi:MAG: hypothetical protein CMQ19_03015 [Gammaproteobacteria bacterium]|nr:hypothetical protein [Gammaproteobacteria bacterium]|tara:strand:+ start:648 stop:1040 length:393 start_codon:yes stop_codon:yes gene_type:complete
MKKYFRYAGLSVVFLWFMGGGIGHFTQTDFFVSIVPPWVPFPLWTVYVSGVFEILLALAILWPRVRSVAGWGLIALTLAVTPANVHMWLNPELFSDVPPTMLSLRLVVQVLLLFTIWWSTRIEEISDSLS